MELTEPVERGAIPYLNILKLSLPTHSLSSTLIELAYLYIITILCLIRLYYP